VGHPNAKLRHRRWRATTGHATDGGWTRTTGTGRSEVKAEGAAKPGPGDMSAARCPLASSPNERSSE